MSRVIKNYPNKITGKYIKGKHNGIDMVANKNGKSATDYIIAHSDGEVVDVRSNYTANDKTGNSYGNYVKIKHDNGYYTLYAHIKYGTVKVKEGDKVKKGNVIGYMGNTGYSTGAHVHFEVRDTKDVKIDPTPYIDSDLPAKKETSSDTSNKPVEQQTFKEGDLVVPTKLVNYNGTTLKQYDPYYTITDLKGDRAVLSANRKGKMVVWASINVKNIKLYK